MLKCWSSNPDDRPLFSGLVKTFKDFISASSVSIFVYKGSVSSFLGQISKQICIKVSVQRNFTPTFYDLSVKI